jgi:hypothetical protein
VCIEALRCEAPIIRSSRAGIRARLTFALAVAEEVERLLV